MEPNANQSTELMDQIEKRLPEMEKIVADDRRLLDLAKQAPFAGANSDFLERIEAQMEKREQEIQMVRMFAKLRAEVEDK